MGVCVCGNFTDFSLHFSDDVSVPDKCNTTDGWILKVLGLYQPLSVQL